MKKIYSKIVVCAGVACLVACSPKERDAKSLGKTACIVPDYTGVTMPCNMVAPTFDLADSLMLDDAQAIYCAGDVTCVVEKSGEDGFCIDEDEWKRLVQVGPKINVRIQGKKGGEWVEYKSFSIYISQDKIDPYLAYRLIEPGYEQWKQMGIYQRDLESYDESAILTNQETNGGCMNCHSFAGGDPKNMNLHLRVDYSGTYIVRDGKMEKHSPETPLVYPFWHPSKRFIAYSQNQTKQMFHTTSRNRIEVFDYASDVVVYDIENRRVLTSPLISSETAFETFPAFSPDGKTLYYCSADSVEIPKDYDKVHYSLCSIAFDASTGEFGDKVDTLYNARLEGVSVSFPRVSPDGRYLMFTKHDYGNFSIWHREADLYMIDLKDKSMKDVSILNSKETDSYHVWSSTGRWVVFSSRRDDGLYTRPYFAHVDKAGNFTKPFELPQADAAYYKRLMKSYNIPELVKGKVDKLKIQ